MCPMHMACAVDPADGQLVMLYKLQKGVSPQSYGMECGRRAGLPPHIIDRARVKSQEFEAAQHKHAAGASPTLSSVACPDDARPGNGKRAANTAIDSEEANHELQRASKVLKVLTCVPSCQELNAKEALQAHRRLTELWERWSS